MYQPPWVVVTDEKVDGVHVRICPMSRFAPTKLFHRKSKKINEKIHVLFCIIWLLKHILSPFFVTFFFLNICTNLHWNVVVTDEKVDGSMSRFAPTKFFHKKIEKKKKMNVLFCIIWALKHILNTFFITFFETSGTNLHGNVVDTDEKVDGVHVQICPRFA